MDGDAIKVIAHGTEKIGVPVVLVGRFVRYLRMTGDAKRLRIVMMSNDRKILIIVGSKTAQTSGSSTTPVCGLFAGFLDSDRRAAVAVLRHEFSVAASGVGGRWRILGASTGWCACL